MMEKEWLPCDLLIRSKVRFRHEHAAGGSVSGRLPSDEWTTVTTGIKRLQTN